MPRLFEKGKSGNPLGRPKDDFHVRELARSYTVEAVGTLVGLMRNSEDEQVKLKACIALIERGHGKPIQEITGDIGKIQQIVVMNDVVKNGQPLRYNLGQALATGASEDSGQARPDSDGA